MKLLPLPGRVSAAFRELHEGYPARMPSAFVVQHGHDSPPGMIGEAAEARGYDLVIFENEQGSHTELPDPGAADIIILTGSEEHWYEIDEHPRLQRELTFIRGAIAADTPILGTCFGGQGLALGLGGIVEPADRAEIGWFEIDTEDPDVVPPGPWFEWHYDRFIPPSDADVLATTDLAIQAFRHGPHLGTQFHPEVNYDMLANWESMIPEYVDAAELVRLTKENESEARPRAYALFDAFLSLRK